MCGIAGFTHQDNKEKLIKLAQESLYLRGPDETNFYTNQFISLLNTRLKVRDLNHGSQPFQDKDHKFTLVYNGELYNTNFLKDKLEGFKIDYSSTSDTEILFWALVHFGKDIIKDIDGMFSFAFYNHHENELLIARDRFGVKPLFYKHSKEFSFASDIKTLTSIDQTKAIKKEGLIDFISHNYITNILTIFEDIYVFPQGHFAVLKENKINFTKYWDLKAPSEKTFNMDKVYDLLDKATQKQLVSDRPLGVFLSSGIDSATISYFAKKHNHHLNTYSVGFQNKNFDETKKANEVAKAIGSNHKSIEFSPQDFINNFKEYIKKSPTPISDLGMYPLFYLTGFAKETSTVLLSGDGGDEIFGGYPTLKASTYHKYISQLPEILTNPPLKLMEFLCHNNHKQSLEYRIKKFKDGLNFNNKYAHYYWRTVFDDKEKSSLNIETSYDPSQSYLKYFKEAKEQGITNIIDQYLYVDFKVWLPQNNFLKVDQATMAHSVEARVPFLDNDLVDYIFSIPAKIKLNRTNKFLLRNAMKEKLPDFCIQHKKEAFHPPYINWFQNELFDFLYTNLLESKLISEYGLNPQYIERLLLEHKDGKYNHAYKLYNLIYLEFWLREHS